MSELSSTDPSTGCPGFEGNSDLYGLGIRIGVYLQWYSTWICITVDPETSAETHTANALFIFAIMVALLQAIGNQSINNIEAYLMLQICFGYLLTLLSVFGLRLQLLQPHRARKITSTILSLFTQKRNELPHPGLLTSFKLFNTETETSIGLQRFFIDSMRSLRGQPVTLRLSELNTLKEGTLSWIGVFWRVSIATTVAITNAILVFKTVDPPLPANDLCRGNGFVFMFTRLEFNGSRLIFLQVVAVAIAVVFGFLASLTVSTFSRFLLHLEALAIGDMILWAMPAELSLLFTRTQRLRKILRNLINPGDNDLRYIIPLVISIGSPILYYMLVFFDSLLENMESIADPSNSYRPGQVFSLYALFSSGARLGKTHQVVVNRKALKNETTTGWKVLTGLWHTWVVGASIWFILSVELTIRWNKISGVHTIESTGQLIPFVIGVASFIRAKHKLIVFMIKKRNPDWENLDMEIVFVGATPVSFRVVRDDQAMSHDHPYYE